MIPLVLQSQKMQLEGQHHIHVWDNGEVTQQATQLWAGIHTVTVTDANQCTAQASITVENLYPPITANIDIITNALYAPYSISCFGACDAHKLHFPHQVEIIVLLLLGYWTGLQWNRY